MTYSCVNSASFRFRLARVGSVVALSTVLVTACAGIDPDKYNAPYVSAAKGTDINIAVNYAENQREKYINAASSLEWPLLGGGAGIIGIGGAMAGAGAAGAAGSTVSGLGAGVATLAGVGEFFKPSERAKIFISGKSAIQCSLDVVLSTFAEKVPGSKTKVQGSKNTFQLAVAQPTAASSGSSWQRLAQAKAALGSIVRSMHGWAIQAGHSENRLMGLAAPGILPGRAKSSDSARMMLQQTLATSRFLVQQRSIASETSATARELMVAVENREKAKLDAPVRLIIAVNAIRAKVDDALKGLIPSIEDIKKAANASLSGSSQGDKAKADIAKDKATKALGKLDALAVLAPMVPSNLIAGGPPKAPNLLSFQALSAPGAVAATSPKDANEKIKKAADAVNETVEREIPGCNFDLGKAAKDAGAKKGGGK